MTNKGFIIFHLLRKVNAFERINQRHPTDHTHTKRSIEVSVHFLHGKCKLLYSRTPPGKSVRPHEQWQ